MNKIIPKSQAIYINSSQGRIFDFDTPSSRVYLGEAVNSLLKVFGNDVVISGFRVLDYVYNQESDIISVTISPGEAILDSTLIKYTQNTNLSIDVSGFDDKSGTLVASIFFNFVQTQQKNLSTIRLTYVLEDGNVPSNDWFGEYSIVLLADFKFDKSKKSVTKNIIPLLDRPKKNIKNKEYYIYPSDNISKRILSYLNDVFY